MKSNSSARSLGKQLVFYGLVGSIIPLLLFGVISLWQGGNSLRVSISTSRDLAYKDLDDIVKGVMAMVVTQQELLEQKVSADLNVAANEIAAVGGVRLTPAQTEWRARNQYTKEETVLSLPRMLIGANPIDVNTDLNKPSPIVDKVKSLVGGTCTVFQRMDEAGSMLRVVTNVETTTGSRAINTFIPAVNPDGKPNPVIQKVMQGERFVGRAFVVNAWYITAYEPIRTKDGEIIGMLYVGIPQESAKSLREQIMKVSVGASGYVYVLDSKGTYVISKQGQRDGEVLWDSQDENGEFFIRDIVNQARDLAPGKIGEKYYHWKNLEEPEARAKIVRFMYFKPWDWIVAAGSYEHELLASKDQIQAVNTQSNTIMAGVFLICVVGCIFLWLFISRGITRPILTTVDILSHISSGDLSQEVQPHMLLRRDEMGTMSVTLKQMVETLRDMVGGLTRGVSTLVSSSADLTAVADRTTAEVGGLAELSQNVAAISEQTSSTTQSISSGMEQASTNLSSVAGATEEMSATVGEIAATTEKARIISEQAMNQTLSISTTMQGLGSAAQEIDKVTETITEISSQTNLLALNATIEAARAGEAGKGFAVVAGEIKELARQTADATEDIKRRISGIQTSTSSAIENTARITQVIRDISDLINSIAAAIEEQSVVTRDVAANIAQASNEVSDANLRLAETASASRNIAEHAGGVRSRVVQIEQGNQQVQSSVTELKQLADSLKQILGQFETREPGKTLL